MIFPQRKQKVKHIFPSGIYFYWFPLDNAVPLWKIVGMETQSPLVRYRRDAWLTQADLAAKLGILGPALCKWENGRVPAERVLDVERVTGISRHDLRPDIYPRENTAA